jgi:hypothetical protein
MTPYNSITIVENALPLGCTFFHNVSKFYEPLDLKQFVGHVHASHKGITSGTHLITRHALPRWPCNSIGGRILTFEKHTTARCSHTGAPLPARPNCRGHTRWICGPCFAGQNSCMRRLCTPLCVARYTYCRDKPGDYSTLSSQFI